MSVREGALENELEIMKHYRVGKVEQPCPLGLDLYSYRAGWYLVLSWGLDVLPYTGLLQLQDSMVWGTLVRQKGRPCSSFTPATKLESSGRGWSICWARPMVLSYPDT